MKIEKEILGKLKNNDKTLTQLDLDGYMIGAQEAIELANTLNTNTTLTYLNLVGNNQIGAEGAQAIANALEKNKNTTLTELYLSDNNIGVEGAQAIAKTLKTNTALTELYLGFNNIEVEGAEAIANALEKNTTLTELSLQHNQIGDEGAKKLAGALKTNTTLTKLYLEGNQTKDEGAQAIANALKENSTVTELDLLNNQIGSEEILESINTSIERNKKIATIKASLLKGEKINGREENKISINDAIYDNDAVELAIKAIVKDLEPDANDSSHKDSIINNPEDVNESNHLYFLVELLNSVNDSREKIFTKDESDIIIKQFVNSDDFIKSIKSISNLQRALVKDQEASQNTQQTVEEGKKPYLQSLPDELRDRIIIQMLPKTVQIIFETYKSKLDKLKKVVDKTSTKNSLGKRPSNQISCLKASEVDSSNKQKLSI